MRFSILTGLLACALSVTAAPEAGKQCPPAVVSLATGIRMNIEGQMAELNATDYLYKLENKSKFESSAFYIGQGVLESDIATGIRIRNYNLAIAPKGNPALPGLHKYATAQLAEKKLAHQLNGKPSHDIPKLKKLQSDIMAGIKLNMNNLKKSTSANNCDLGFTFPPYP